MTLVKICGVRSPEIAQVAATSGADLFGLIFAPSRRLVSDDLARQIVSAVRSQPSQVLAVGVFVNDPAERMNAVAETVGLDIIQLSGDGPPEIMVDLNRPVIKVLRLPAGTTLDAARSQAERHLDANIPARALMLDTHVAGSYGGNGLAGDWDLAARLAKRYPIFLAGGLSPDNVAAAISSVEPLAVDVSSGVETDGVKDADKIRQFLANARAADERAGRKANDDGPARSLVLDATSGTRRPR